jgi:hypothetical protein
MLRENRLPGVTREVKNPGNASMVAKSEKPC